MIYADTEGLLDRCHCGAVAGFETGKDPDTGEVSERARCTECCEQTRWSETRGEAMADWNWNMRRLSNNCFNLTPTAQVKQMFLEPNEEGGET